jgi:glyoxylase-like metal-dependent hydrolase (beta-lactamase superfamily II)
MKHTFTKVSHGIQVRVSLPFPLKWVNSYLIEGDDGYTIIDPGLNTGKSVDFWQAVLKELNIQLADINKIVLTHHHPDHYGLAGWFQEHSKAPVLLSAKGYEQVLRFWGDQRDMSKAFSDLFEQHGMEAVFQQEIYGHMEDFVEMVSPAPDIQIISPGEQITLGNTQYDMVETHGHAYGHLSFYHKEEFVIFCGDQVLPQISPNVSLLPGIDDNPLASFLISLKAMTELEVKWAYPGHREPFDSFNERAQALINHHLDRLKAMTDKLVKPMTAYELCKDYFGQKLSVHQLRFAMSETLAHLVYLELEGILFKEVKNGLIYFRR